MINSEEIVVITPNWVKQQKPESAVVVGPNSLREIIRFIKTCNPKRLIVATGSGEKSTSDIMAMVVL